MVFQSTRALTLIASAALAVSMLAGCHANALSPTMVASNGASALKKPNKPKPKPELVFVTIKAKVVEVLPDDTHGLPHQNFVVEEIAPEAGAKLTCNNDTKYGAEVPGLKVGQVVTIRGVMYHNGNGNDGIHWTHHKDVIGDAGFIQTADGRKYE